MRVIDWLSPALCIVGFGLAVWQAWRDNGDMENAVLPLQQSESTASPDVQGTAQQNRAA
jgi:hypothetical protein